MHFVPLLGGQGQGGLLQNLFSNYVTLGDFQFFQLGGSTGERDSDDGRPLSAANRRPSISAPISARKPSGSSRVHTPPPASPGFLGDGASSTPKRLATDGKQLQSKVKLKKKI